tara:strand:+ start:8147 stop:9304 length:1158 start_codon:yes stop_codon:yes gene_type:complete
MPKEIENKIDEDSSAIVKSTGSELIETPKPSLPNLKPRDKETGEITSITAEQLQSIRNGLATTIKLTDQIVKIIGDGNKSLNKDITKIGNLRRRLRDNNSKIRDITGKKGIMGGMMGGIQSKAKAVGTPLLGAGLLELLANADKIGKGALIATPTIGKSIAKSKPVTKMSSKIKKANRVRNMRRVIRNRNKVKVKSGSLLKKPVKPKVDITKGKITGSTPTKAPSVPKSLASQTTKKATKTGLRRILGRSNLVTNTLFAAWEFSDRRSDKDGDGKPDQTVLQAAAGTGGGLAGGLAGAAIGQAIIPIPILGAVIGGVVGSMIGGSAADKITGANKKDDIKAKNEPNRNVKGIKKNNELNLLNKDTSKTNVEVYILDSDQDFELNP